MVSPGFNPKQGGLGTAFLTTMLYRVEHKGLGKKMQGTCKREESQISNFNTKKNLGHRKSHNGQRKYI